MFNVWLTLAVWYAVYGFICLMHNCMYTYNEKGRKLEIKKGKERENGKEVDGRQRGNDIHKMHAFWLDCESYKFNTCLVRLLMIVSTPILHIKWINWIYFARTSNGIPFESGHNIYCILYGWDQYKMEENNRRIVHIGIYHCI